MFQKKVRENIISQITDLMCRVDWQDHELRNVWTALENLRSLLPTAGRKVKRVSVTAAAETVVFKQNVKEMQFTLLGKIQVGAIILLAT